jgi:hypothetical protein
LEGGGRMRNEKCGMRNEWARKTEREVLSFELVPDNSEFLIHNS